MSLSYLFCSFKLFKGMCPVCSSFCTSPKIYVAPFVHSVSWVNIMGCLNGSEKQDAFMACSSPL